jgi:class 3 adenylate cyclase
LRNKGKAVPHTWNHDRAEERIEAALAQVEDVKIVTYSRDLSLENIPTNKAYRVDAAHLYLDVINLDEMLNCTSDEGVTCHRRTLRFLNLHQRAVHRVLSETGAKRVDFHNQRLHAIVPKPYGGEDSDEAARIHAAIAIAQLIIEVVAQTGDSDEHIPDAKVRAGIDSGEALAVNNGRRGNRESLFLGAPANLAAKLSGAGGKGGIYLTNHARRAIGLTEAANPATTALSRDEIAVSQDAAALDVTADEIVKAWREDNEANPIGTFEFSGHTPPLRTLDIEALTPSNSRRQNLLSTYADLDGFTAYVSAHIADNAEDVVRVLHVLRAEMDNVLSSDFEGRRVRFIGDCIHGIMCEGTAQTTDVEASISDTVLCAGALRSSFELALKKLEDAEIDVHGLGLQIGFEFGPVATTRLGMQGSRVRCSVGRAVRASEAEQMRCGTNETAIGERAYCAATEAVRDLFGVKRKVANLDYNEAVEALASGGDETAKKSKRTAFVPAAPAVVRATEVQVKPHLSSE